MSSNEPAGRHTDDRRPLSVWRGRTSSQRWQYVLVMLILPVAVYAVTAFHH
jgi:hypothetical protein